MRFARQFLTAIIALLIASPAYAWDWFVDAKISVVEPDYVPNNVSFTISLAGGTCAAGQFLNYIAQGTNAAEKQANINAVLAALMTAQARNTTVRIFGNNAGCTVSNIWLMAN